MLRLCALALSMSCTLASEILVDKPVQGNDLVTSRLVQVTSLIGAAGARRDFFVDGTGLTAAVVDTGLRATHVDFAGKVVRQVNLTEDNGGNASNARDGHGHGTNVAGIICANGDHVGIAPGANILPIKVLQDTGAGTFQDVENALLWVLENHDRYNITVVNMSLGDSGNYAGPPILGDMQRLIQELRSLRIAVVVAAGNEYFTYQSQGMGYPAIISDTISVGAVYDADIGRVTDSHGGIAYSTAPGRITPFSQRLSSAVAPGGRTDIFAPGSMVTSSGILGDHGESTMQGTSMATPVVSGVVLLLQQYCLRATGELPTVDQLEEWLRSGGVVIADGDDEDDNVAHTRMKYPRLDAYGALFATGLPLGMHPPMFVSFPMADPSPALLGQAIRFYAAAFDVDGTPLECRWDFGDGSNGEGPAVSHYYLSAGPYDASVVALGKDGAVIERLHVDVLDHVGLEGEFWVDRLGLRLDFRHPGRDSCRARGRVSGDYFHDGQRVLLVMGGLEVAFVMGQRGAAKNDHGHLLARRGRFVASLHGLDAAGEWERSGLANADIGRHWLTMLVTLAIGDKILNTQVSLRYSARRGRSGTARP